MPKTIISSVFITFIILILILIFYSLASAILLLLFYIFLTICLYFDVMKKFNYAVIKYSLINKYLSLNIYNIINIDKHLEKDDIIYKSFYSKNPYKIYVLTYNKLIIINKKFNCIETLHIFLNEISEVTIDNVYIKIKLKDESIINIELYPHDVLIGQEILKAQNSSKINSTINFVDKFDKVDKVDKEEYKRKKGRSLLKLLEEYIVIDLETTGLDSINDEIIEIGAIKISKGEEIERFNTLICPIKPINSFIESHTGITNDMVKDAPTIKEVLPVFYDFIKDSILLAHNAHFDIDFLYDSIKKHFDYDFKNNFIDTLRLSRMVFPDLKNHKLETLCKTFKLSTKVEHRAICDCILTYKLYEHMKYYIKNDNLLINKIG